MNFNQIKLIISDIDGVWTDGTIYKGTDGMEFKRFTVLDGVGVAVARAAEIKIALISARFSPATEYRAKELEIEDVYNGGLNKIPAFEELKNKYSLSNEEIAYIGDDLIDIPIMEQVGLPIAVPNAVPEVKAIAKHITSVPGGNGAFREAVCWIIEQQGRTKQVMEKVKEKVLNS